MAKRSKKRDAARAVPAPKAARTAQNNRDGFLTPALIDWLFWPAIAAVLFLTYMPVWNGSMIWDDDAHLTRAGLQSYDGPWHIWFDLHATQQYYPVIHSIFWLEFQLWQHDTLGYHLVNIFLQSLAAFLLLKTLRFLEIPGALLAAGIFALHPIQVETVAWMTELKNLLSGVCYFSAALLYLHYDRTRDRKLYGLALFIFIIGLLSKSVIATLPGALLVIFWWQRGKIAWKKDAQPLIPFFAIGLFSGLFTAWVEKRFVIGIATSDFNLPLIDRVLVAGRNIWFYPSKLLWPQHLIFIYPRWQIDPAAWWQYLFPLAAVVLGGVLLWLSRRWRAPLAGFLYYVGTLVPALGFVNVYPFRYSFVADHFQYLACLGIIVPCAAGLTLLFTRLLPAQPGVRVGLALALLALLSVISWKRTWAYRDMETIWRDTIAQNPTCWLACNDLGTLLDNEGQIDNAIALYKQAIKIYPRYAKAFTNLGYTAGQKGNTLGAVAFYQQALQLDPNQAEALNNYGIILAQTGQTDEAFADFQKATKSNPHYSYAYMNMGNIYYQRKQYAQAADEYQQAITLDPYNPHLHELLAKAQAALTAPAPTPAPTTTNSPAP